jgi:hypothetical protein
MAARAPTTHAATIMFSLEKIAMIATTQTENPPIIPAIATKGFPPELSALSVISFS